MGGPDPASVEAMRAAFKNTPLHAFLGLRFVEPPPADGTVVVEMPVAEAAFTAPATCTAAR
jgi:hypothetical protein